MLKARKVLNYLFYSFALIAFGFMLLYAVDNYSYIDTIEESARTYYIWMNIVGCVLAIVVLTLSIIGLARIESGKSTNSKLNFIYLVILIYGIGSLAEYFFFDVYVSIISDYSVTMHLGLWVVFTLISVIASIVALCLKSKPASKGKYIAGLIATAPLFVVWLLDLFSENVRKVLPAFSSFSFFILFITGIAISILYLIPCKSIEAKVAEIAAPNPEVETDK